MLMRQLGLSDKRLRWEYLGVPDWIQFVDVITEMDKDLRELGPNLLTRR
jgi:coenzyme F420-reducing hydrogenase delta subunit